MVLDCKSSLIVEVLLGDVLWYQKKLYRIFAGIYRMWDNYPSQCPLVLTEDTTENSATLPPNDSYKGAEEQRGTTCSRLRRAMDEIPTSSYRLSFLWDFD